MVRSQVGEVFLEFQRIGSCVKVTAIDPASLTEVSVMGPPSAGDEILGRNAIKKLAYALGRPGPSARPS
jgi:hypothetical protein